MEDVYKAKINEEGRLVIPAAYRKQYGLGNGQEVVLRATDEGLLIWVQLASLQANIRDFRRFAGISLN